MKKLSLEWTAGMTPEEAESFEKLLRNNVTLAKRINYILDRWEDGIKTQETDPNKIYQSPNWSTLQAHFNGDRYRIQKLRQLFSFYKES